MLSDVGLQLVASITDASIHSLEILYNAQSFQNTISSVGLTIDYRAGKWIGNACVKAWTIRYTGNNFLF